MLFVRKLRRFLALLMPIWDGKFYPKPALAVPAWYFFLCYFNYLSYTQYIHFNLSDFLKIVLTSNSKLNVIEELISNVDPKAH